MPETNVIRVRKRPASATPSAGSRHDARHDANNRLFFRLFQAANLYETHALRTLKITAVQGAVLGALSRDAENGMSFSDLYLYLSVSRQNLDAVLKRLERMDYVARSEGAVDRRTKIVRLTPAGIEAWRKLYGRTIEFFRQATAELSMEDSVACADMLAKIGRGLKATRLTDETP